MILLPHGCYCTGTPANPKKGTHDVLSVHPSNWASPKAKLDKLWYIQYRYYDPTVKTGKYAKGKLCIIKGGLNQLKTHIERQTLIPLMIENEIHLLKSKGYNPITKKFVEPLTEVEMELHPTARFDDALRYALKKLTGVKGTIEDATSVVKYVCEAADQLRLSGKPICSIRCQHLSNLLDYMQGRDKVFSDKKYNRYRSNLVMLYKRLFKLGVVEANYAELIDRKKVIKHIRVTLTPLERKIIKRHLKKHTPPFYRFTEIFFHSGGRETELMAVKAKDVDLKNQRYKVIIKKGREYREEYKIIKNIALPFWKQAMKDCPPEYYLFSKGLVPGPVAIASNQICRRWKRWVKDDLYINADFYSLKHSNTTEVVEALDEASAAKLNNHKSTAMVINIYDTKQKQRKEDKIKKIKNAF